MKIVLSVFCLTFVGQLFAQNFFEQKLDQFFPNRKKKQIEALTHQRDSLKRANDSLDLSLINAAEKIANHKKEILDLKTELFNEQQSAKATKEQLKDEVAELLDSINRISFPLVSCVEESFIIPGNPAPSIVNKCTWRHFQLVENGVPDDKGRYTWTTEIFKLNGSTPKKVDISDLFKAEKITELETMINARLEEDFKSLKETDANCFYKFKSFPAFKLKDMRLAFNENSEMIFEIQYGLPEYCFAVNSASTGIKINELKEMFAE